MAAATNTAAAAAEVLVPPAQQQQQQHQPPAAADQQQAKRSTAARRSRPLDAASAWQQQQRLQAALATIAALPAAEALPQVVSTELARVMCLLQRSAPHSDAASAAADAGQHAALQLAAQRIRTRLLLRLQPPAAAAACVHAHLFAAWCKGRVGSTSISSSVGMGPCSGWRLSSNQYAGLVHQLGMLPLLLDSLAWLQPAAVELGLSVQQQHQVLLLLEAAGACPPLAAQLLQQLLALPHPSSTQQHQAHSCSSTGSSRSLPAAAALLLLTWWAAGSEVVGSGIMQPADRAACLQGLCQAVERLLPAGPATEQQLAPPASTHVLVMPPLVLHALQEEQQERQEQGVDAASAGASSVCVSDMQLLAAALQLLQDVLLAWGPQWFAVPAAASATGPWQQPLTPAAVASVLAQLTAARSALQARLLPALGAPEQPQQVQRECCLLQLPLPDQQLAAHTASRIMLTVGMAQQQPGQQADPGVPPDGAAGQSSAWQAVCADPFAWPAQQQLRCACQEQQQGEGLCRCWLCCLVASQPQHSGAAAAAAAAAGGVRTQGKGRPRLPCSLITQTPSFPGNGAACCPPLRPAPVFVLQPQHSTAAAASVGAAAAHITGLLAAWLSPGFSLGSCSDMQLPASTPLWPCAPSSSSSSCGSSSGGLCLQLAAVAGSDSFGPLMLCAGLLDMLLHAVGVQQDQEQQLAAGQAPSLFQGPGLVQLLLGMLAAAMPTLRDPAQQQLVLAAVNPAAPPAAAAAAPASSSSSSSSDAARRPWTWLRQQLSAQHSPRLAAAAARGLVAASNRLVAATDDGGGAAGSSGGGWGPQPPPSAAVVMPLQQQQALLVAELMQALQLYAALWPQLTVRRLLQDGAQHRSQQPLVVQLLTGVKATFSASEERGSSSLLMTQLVQLLLPPEPAAAASASDSGSTGGSHDAAAAPLELSEAQHTTAVAMVHQLVAAGLLSPRQALAALCCRPLQLLWAHGWEYVRGPGQLRLLLLLLQELLHLQLPAPAVPPPPPPPPGAVAAADLLTQQPLPACQCPLVVLRESAEAADKPSVRWLLLGLARLQQLLQQRACEAGSPDFKAISQTAAVLEALVASLAPAGGVLQLQDGGPGASASSRGPEEAATQVDDGARSLSRQELLRLPWQQRLLLCTAVRPRGPAEDAAWQQQLLQPNSATQGPDAAATAVAVLLDCCCVAGATDAFARQLVRAILAPDAARRDASSAPAAGVDGVVCAGLAAAARSQLLGSASTQQLLKRSLVLALGQWLPWASEPQAARVLLRLAPALLLASSHLQQPTAAVTVEPQLWQSEVQLVCKALLLFLLHGKWPPAGDGSGVAAAAAAAAAAKQMAAEQCFRHVASLALHAVVQQQQLDVLAAGGAALQQLQLLQAVLQELCGLAAALARAAYDCAALSPVVLQLLTRLADLIGAGDGGSGGSDAGGGSGGDRAAASGGSSSAAAAWQGVRVAGNAGTSVDALLAWIGGQLALLPAPLRASLGAGVAHVVEARLAAALGRELTAGEAAALEDALLGG